MSDHREQWTNGQRLMTREEMRRMGMRRAAKAKKQPAKETHTRADGRGTTQQERKMKTAGHGRQGGQ